jgi:pimeloyl-ACP methyl ester carboxylesterase
MSTLVYIPGLVSDARVWRPVAEALGGDHVLADSMSAGSIEGMARQALGLAEGPLVPVGHSMGARVAVEMARQAPERVTGLVLADTGHHPLAPGETEKREAKIALAHRDMAALVADWLPPMVDAGRHGDTALMEDLRAMVMAAGPDLHERQIRALMGRPDAGAALAELRVPLLLLVGETDLWSPPAQHEEIAALAPGAESTLVTVPGAGHFLPLERPEPVVRAMRDWLARHFGG